LDFSNARFSLNGSPPDLLPYRLRLCSGETRYAYDISLDEVHQCGYTGPHELPELSADKIAEWDSSVLEYKIRSKTEEELKTQQQHLDALSYIELRLLEEVDFLKNLENFTELYIKTKSLFFNKLKELKNLNIVLTIDLVKDSESKILDNLGEISMYRTKEELLAAYEKHISELKDQHKRTYEKYGLIFINPCFYDLFRLDSSWIKGTEPYPGLLPNFVLDFRSSN
jgi:hypothetical protein